MVSFFRFIVLACVLLAAGTDTFALAMKGRVFDIKTNQPLPNVNIVNTFTELGMTTDSTGAFTIQVEPGHLVEFRRIGYKIVRIRIAADQLPYYSIAMKEGAFDLEQVDIVSNNYRTDSIEKRETYKWAIDHYTLDGMDVIQHPFDALSKRNRQIWAFQKRYDYFEKEKFVDYVFNARLIARIGTVDSADMEDYRRYYRPPYEQVKAWSEYDFLEYIKRSAADFKRRKNNTR